MAKAMQRLVQRASVTGPKEQEGDIPGLLYY